jgi:hypothetical protein
LLALSYTLNNVTGPGLAGWHALNLLIHAVNSLLVYAVLRRLTHDDDVVFRDQRLAAFLAALVFALHPAQTEAVTYLSGRSTSAAALFALLSILLWLRGREYEDRTDLYLRSPLAFALALLCREYVAVLPAALLLVARLQSGRTKWLRYALRESAVHWLVLAAALGAAFTLPGYRALAPASLDLPDLAARLLAQAQAIAYLAGQMVQFDRLNADPALRAPAAFEAAGIAVAGAVFASAALGLLALRRYPVLAFSILWFLLWLVPVHAFVARLDVAHDRQLYLAVIGPALGAARLLLRMSPRIVQWALVPVLALGLAFATYQRNQVYFDEIVFWRDVAAKAPHNARAFAHLGYALAVGCRGDDAEQVLLRALELDPESRLASTRLAQLRAATLPGMPAACAPAPAVTPPAPPLDPAPQ